MATHSNQPIAVTSIQHPPATFHPVFGPPVHADDYRAYVAGDHQRRRDGGIATAPPTLAEAAPANKSSSEANSDLTPSPSMANTNKFFSLSEIIAQNKVRADARKNFIGSGGLLAVGSVAIQNEEWDDFYGPPVRKRAFQTKTGPDGKPTKERDRFAWKTEKGETKAVPVPAFFMNNGGGAPAYGGQPLQPQQQQPNGYTYAPPYMQQGGYGQQQQGGYGQQPQQQGGYGQQPQYQGGYVPPYMQQQQQQQQMHVQQGGGGYVPPYMHQQQPSPQPQPQPQQLTPLQMQMIMESLTPLQQMMVQQRLESLSDVQQQALFLQYLEQNPQLKQQIGPLHTLDEYGQEAPPFQEEVGPAPVAAYSSAGGSPSNQGGGIGHPNEVTPPRE